MIPNLIKTAFADNNIITIKKVTNVRTITDAMNQSEIYKGMLNEVDKLLKIYFTFPVTIIVQQPKDLVELRLSYEVL